MSPFEEIEFQGVFREYQQRVLDNLEAHHDDKKIHIVAAPGSGKTILGLELIRQLGAPALILSPTGVIRSQWGQRWEELFLTREQKVEDYYAESIDLPKPLTSLTYQAFYSLWEHHDRSQWMKFISQAGIQTICLDEAHHLKRNWHRALEEFLTSLPVAPTIISLTATPPTDSTPGEWGRYISLAGEVDEEITIPELVADKTLCPHQDFLYFNHPSQEELAQVHSHQKRVTQCVDELLAGDLVERALLAVGAIPYDPKKEDWLFAHTHGVRVLLSMAQKKKLEIPKKTRKAMFARGRVEPFTLVQAEEAFQFLLDQGRDFPLELSESLRETLLRHHLIHGEKVSLHMTEATLKSLEQSKGKLKSIGEIARAEQAELGDGLRLVVLTDRINREFLPIIGSGAAIMELGAVPVFETVRHMVHADTPMAILTGSIVVVPAHLLSEIDTFAAANEITVSAEEINGSGYCQITLGGSNSSRVEIITQLLEQGKIHIIVGTKALLGEGWDSPCVNSLIIASGIGSYVSSNQMRGRAIRKDSCNPQKVSNIWHLITVLPPSDLPYESKEIMYSEDYSVLSRRFLAFMAPTYNGAQIENGISRVEGIRPPYDREGIQTINQYMTAQAADRTDTASSWKTALGGGGKMDIINTSQIPFTAAPPNYLFKNILHLSTLAAILTGVFWAAGNILVFADSMGEYLVLGIGGLLILALGVSSARRILKRMSPWRYINQIAQSLLNTLVELKEIQSDDVALFAGRDPLDFSLQCGLSGGTLREKRIFARALEEMLSPIDSPRYVIFRRKGRGGKANFRMSFACPAILSTHRQRVSALQKQLQEGTDQFDVAYTLNPQGRDILLSCLKESYINRNSEHVKTKRIVMKEASAEETFAGFQRRIAETFKSFFWGMFGGLRR